MNRRYFAGLLCLALILTFPLFFGCSTTKAFLKIEEDKPFLKKKVMVFPPTDLSGLPEGKAAQATKKLANLLNNSPQLLIYTPPEGMTVSEDVKMPEYGVSSFDPQTVEIAEDMNMNALMAAFLPPIVHSNGRKGIWPFRYDIEKFKISIIINVLDVTNGCLYLTDFTTKEVTIPSKELDQLSEQESLSRALDRAMPRILKSQSLAVVNILEKKPWKGRILEEDNGAIKINAGKDVGVFPDQMFIVYSNGGKFVCRAGRSVDMLGEKIGQIKAVSIMEDYTLAHPVSGGPFTPGQIILSLPN